MGNGDFDKDVVQRCLVYALESRRRVRNDPAFFKFFQNIENNGSVCIGFSAGPENVHKTLHQFHSTLFMFNPFDELV
jgi:hypothetical protein